MIFLKLCGNDSMTLQITVYTSPPKKKLYIDYSFSLIKFICLSAIIMRGEINKEYIVHTKHASPNLVYITGS